MSGSSVRRPDTLATARTYLEQRDWAKTRKQVVDENLYQLNAESSRKRVAGELVKRLQTLTDEELSFLVASYGDDQSAMLWVSVCRTYEFVHDLSIGILKERYESGIPTYTTGAYETFFEEQAALHVELERLTPGSRKKMRNQVFLMLAECRLLSEEVELVEHEAARWLSKDELTSVNWLPADLQLLDAIRTINQ